MSIETLKVIVLFMAPRSPSAPRLLSRAQMDHLSQPLSKFFRRTLFRTSQGLVFLFISAIYLFGAILFGLLEVTPPFGLPKDKTVVFCLGFPVIFFVLFIKQNIPSWDSSWSASIWLFLYGITPLAWVYLANIFG